MENDDYLVDYYGFEQVIEQNIIEKAELSGFYESK